MTTFVQLGDPAEVHVRLTTHLRVRFADTDAAGIVHYADYLAFFETGRAEAFRQLGLSQARLVACELQAPVLEATLRYRTPARFDEVLSVQVWVAELTNVRFRFGYEIHRATDQAVVATGETLHAWTEPVSEPAATPEWLRAALVQLSDQA